MKKSDEKARIKAMKYKMMDEWLSRPTRPYAIFQCNRREEPLFFTTYEQMEEYFEQHVKPNYIRQ